MDAQHPWGLKRIEARSYLSYRLNLPQLNDVQRHVTLSFGTTCLDFPRLERSLLGCQADTTGKLRALL